MPPGVISHPNARRKVFIAGGGEPSRDWRASDQSSRRLAVVIYINCHLIDFLPRLSSSHLAMCGAPLTVPHARHSSALDQEEYEIDSLVRKRRRKFIIDDLILG